MDNFMDMIPHRNRRSEMELLSECTNNEFNEINIWFDDVREPPKYGDRNYRSAWNVTCDDYVEGYSAWVWVKTYDELVVYLEQNALPSTISLDHYLGEERTGYDLLKWMIETNHMPKYIHCHSDNPSGHDRIVNLWNDYYWDRCIWIGGSLTYIHDLDNLVRTVHEEMFNVHHKSFDEHHGWDFKKRPLKPEAQENILRAMCGGSEAESTTANNEAAIKWFKEEGIFDGET